MGLLLVVVALAAVFVIAAVVVGREARRLGALPHQQVFDFEDAVTYVCDHVGFDVAAVLSPDDVRRILSWHLEYFRLKGMSGNGSGEIHDGPVFVTGTETVGFVLGQAERAGASFTSEQVHAVLDAQVRYLEEIGALGELDDDDDLPPVPPDFAP